MSLAAPGMVRLSELPDRVLLNILRRRGWTLAHNGIRHDTSDGFLDRFDTPEFTHAEEAYRGGDTAEALIWLEHALPDTFAGLSTAAVPAPSR